LPARNDELNWKDTYNRLSAERPHEEE